PLLWAASLSPRALLVRAGDGPLRAALEQRAIALGIHDRVLFLGERKDIPALLARCDVFVLPSLNEGLPLTVLEAMAAERPVVATNVGGLPELVADGVRGILVPPAGPRALAGA